MERRGGLAATRSQLKTMLRGERHATSTQVEREWNRIVIGTCVALRNALASAEDWTDVVKIMTKGFGRTASRHWQVTHWIAGPDTANLAVVQKRLDDFERIRARVYFHEGLDTIRDGTECGIVERRPYRKGAQWHYDDMCKKTDTICRQPEFLADNIDRARAAAEALEGSLRTGDADMGRNAAKALADKAAGATKGKACHGAGGLGGDICIALECGSDEILLTTDASFDLICPALDIQHERVPDTRSQTQNL
jgi:hypothetical protein